MLDIFLWCDYVVMLSCKVAITTTNCLKKKKKNYSKKEKPPLILFLHMASSLSLTTKVVRARSCMQWSYHEYIQLEAILNTPLVTANSSEPYKLVFIAKTRNKERKIKR